MIVSMEVQGGERVALAYETRLQRLANLNPMLLAMGVTARDEFVRRIRVGGDPAWAPDAPSTIEAKGSSHPGVDSGTMMRSVQVGRPEGASIDVGISGPPGAAPGEKASVSSYAYWFNYGTGEYAGHSAWTIAPTMAKALAWTVGGATHFARQVTARGQPPRPIVYYDGPLAQRLLAVARRYLGGGPFPAAA